MNVKKTPVSILHEMMVKRGTVPAFEIILHEGGSHQNVFTYEVTCMGLRATGTGRCKKDAKHEAASAMLEAIAKHNSLPQLPPTPCESPVRTPLPMELPTCPKSPPHIPFKNMIAVLQELCISNNLDNPEYREISDIGPPHARIFTYHCVVSTFVEEGVATTKKQAKHDAARKMVERIEGVVPDGSFELLASEIKKKEQISSEMAMARYPTLSAVHSAEIIKSKINWGLRVKDFHKELKESFEEGKRDELLIQLEVLLELIQQSQSHLCENSNELKEKFQDLWSSVEIEFRLESFPSVNKSKYVVGVQLLTAPDIVAFGIGQTEPEAEILALENVLNSVKLLLN